MKAANNKKVFASHSSMGCFSSKEEKAASERSKVIDQKIRNDAQSNSSQTKLLLLGWLCKLIINVAQIFEYLSNHKHISMFAFISK